VSCYAPQCPPLPAPLQYADSMASKLVERYNLTHVVKDMERVYYSLPISLNCTKVGFAHASPVTSFVT